MILVFSCKQSNRMNLTKKSNQLKSMSILLIYVQAVYIYYLQFIYFL